jgi:hypothetical protein
LGRKALLHWHDRRSIASFTLEVLMSGETESIESRPPVERTSQQQGADWRLAQRVARSEVFARSEFLPKFLLYICDRQLRGKTREITEQQIGERVFGRPVGYNPGDDNIVRNYAGQLRKRLEMYYESEGREDAIRISIPRGGYVPVFLPRNPNGEAFKSTATSLPIEPAEVKSPGLLDVAPILPASVIPIRRDVGKNGPDWRMFLLGCLLGSSLFGAFFLLKFRHRRPEYPPSHPLWSEIFSNERDTFIVPADSGLGILQNLTGLPVSLADYASGKYLSDLKTQGMDDANLEDLRTQRYTSIADLNIASKLARLPEVIPDRFVIRYARDLRTDDLRNGNAVLLGAIHTDPWEALLQQQLNFRFVCESQVNACSIVNQNPLAGEKRTYNSDLKSSLQQTYAVIAFIPNLSRTGHILFIGGLNMAGTQAAANMLLDEASMRPVIQRGILPDGSLRSFELLVETSSLGAEALPSRIIASRYGP